MSQWANQQIDRAFETFQIFNAINLNFNTESYDYFKYSGTTSITLDGFKKKPAKTIQSFVNYSNWIKTKNHDPVWFFFATLKSERVWPGFPVMALENNHKDWQQDYGTRPQLASAIRSYRNKHTTISVPELTNEVLDRVISMDLAACLLILVDDVPTLDVFQQVTYKKMMKLKPWYQKIIMENRCP
jgi:hypothetical protein